MSASDLKSTDTPDADLGADPRLDESAWRVFGRRFPRRWSLYARVLAGLLLLLFLGWWFTRDVTYVSNVKVAGLDAVEQAYVDPLRTLSSDFAGLVNRLTDLGYSWQSGGLPSMRAADALTESRGTGLVALGTLEVKKGGASLFGSSMAAELADYLASRGWEPPPDSPDSLEGATKQVDGLHAVIVLERRPEGREALLIEVRAATKAE